MASITQAWAVAVTLSTTNLQNLQGTTSTIAWQSALVDLQTSVKPLDVEIGFKTSMANTAPANDKAIYIYACPAMYDGSAWFYTDQGTTILPTGVESTSTIALPNNLKLLGVLNYTTQKQDVNGTFNLSNAVGQSMPDGFSLVINNYTGSALSVSTTVLYRTLTQTVA